MISVYHHAADAFALVHQIEALVDVSERHVVPDHRVDLDLALHVPVDNFWHVRATAGAAESSALPDTAGDELERTSCDFRTSGGDADDDGLSPAAMAGLPRLTHDRHVSGAIERVVGPADLIGAVRCHVDEGRDEVATELLRFAEMRHSEPFTPFPFAIVGVDPDDHVGAGKPQPLDHVEADAAQAENHAFRAGHHFA